MTVMNLDPVSTSYICTRTVLDIVSTLFTTISTGPGAQTNAGRCLLSLLVTTCCMLTTFANSLDLDQDQQSVGPDLDPSRLTR